MLECAFSLPENCMGVCACVIMEFEHNIVYGNISDLGADDLIPGGGAMVFVKKKDCSANFGK